MRRVSSSEQFWQSTPFWSTRNRVRIHFSYTLTPKTLRRCYGTTVFSYEHYKTLCKNKFLRYAHNPFHTAYLLEQRDKRSVQVFQFSFQDAFKKPDDTSLFPRTYERINTGLDYYYIVPAVHIAKELDAIENTQGDLIFQGKYHQNRQLISQPLCRIDLSPKDKPSSQYTFHAMGPANKATPPTITTPLFINANSERMLKNKKGGNSKSSGTMKIVNADVPSRIAITHRDPNQNEVMSHTAVDAYKHCYRTYETHLHPNLITLLSDSANILHFTTLKAMRDSGELLPDAVYQKHRKNRHFRPEWLHRHSFGLTPMAQNPQEFNNLGAARALDNTRMMLIEDSLKWVSQHIPKSINHLSGHFNMFLDTQVIEGVKLDAKIKLNGTQIKLSQTIDTLATNPQHTRASDLAGLVALVNLLLQNCEPHDKQIVTIKNKGTNLVSTFLSEKDRFFTSTKASNQTMKKTASASDLKTSLKS